MSEVFQRARSTALADQYGYVHQVGAELARGGQGVVYRTGDADLAIKQPLGPDGEPDHASNLQSRFENIRTLPIPPRIPISLPLATLRDGPGYVMQLLNDMRPFSIFDLSGDRREQIARSPRPAWLAGIEDVNTVATLMHYAESGSTKHRLIALSKVAAILGRLHAAGLVYGDISLNNCFIDEGYNPEVWLIDADNLRCEVLSGGNSVYTPRLGAPEVVQGRDQSRPRTDAWAFTVMAFEMLALVHPFIGQKVLDPDDDAGGWDAEPVAAGAPADLDEQAYAGFLPFVDDEDDDTNITMSGLPRGLVLTAELSRLFQETLSVGRTKPWRRPAMSFWAFELMRAHDQSITCPGCRMSYYRTYDTCPFCSAQRPGFVVATTDRWQMTVQGHGQVEVPLPHRLFNPFSLELNGRTDFEALIDFDRGTATHVRGTGALPAGLDFELVRGGL